MYIALQECLFGLQAGIYKYEIGSGDLKEILNENGLK
jgi:hypothetical protein